MLLTFVINRIEELIYAGALKERQVIKVKEVQSKCSAIQFYYVRTAKKVLFSTAHHEVLYSFLCTYVLPKRYCFQLLIMKFYISLMNTYICSVYTIEPDISFGKLTSYF